MPSLLYSVKSAFCSVYAECCAVSDNLYFVWILHIELFALMLINEELSVPSFVVLYGTFHVQEANVNFCRD